MALNLVGMALKASAQRALSLTVNQSACSSIGQWGSRHLSTRSEAQIYPQTEPVRQVFISQSSDIFTNLALEDWLYRHHDFKRRHLLLLWRNDPCVVIGRHQNPWTESNVPYIRNSDVDLARRNSGGGTVFHDMGNINCTFFTQRSEYHRKHNLDISGTAAKLGKDNAYHHCTVLVDVNECVLHEALNSKATGVETRATQSVRVPVKNVCAVDPSVDVESLQESLGWEFLRTSLDGQDGGMEISKRFDLPEKFFSSVCSVNSPEIVVELEVNQGTIQNVRIQLPFGLLDADFDISTLMHGLPFGADLPRLVEDRLLAQSHEDPATRDKIEFLANCVEKLTRDVV
ncbi:hypothetical protein TCAL_08451 [Tigriopus californicus]|uniref:BPL/LPL catalytic domain-containing protein n=1 Tax=Tigriopus californicus TaxID=6832 RepID=A0A553P3F8_TIGCA|nr:hypothetical protein TCAL_08451 [Tigriopus californicus]|eukprot:TCALIF_08451-PA protein Name:"Similar to Lipt1 Lipoyltransferase 1, mitochondrial (Mus musculus)" AED:0.07 eAED:0.07 QI:963/0.6/0.66/1/0.8/0.66/6/485/343